jgi:hypothetical protein
MNASLATIFRTIAAAGVACCIVGCATSPQTSPATLGAPSSASQARFTRSIHATASPPAAHAKPAGPGWISPAAASGQGLIYVANGGAVLIFPNSSQSSPVGTITTGVSGAYGIFVDAYLNVYVCNSAANTVTVYAPGQITPSSTYAMNLSRPLYAVADPNRLFVGNANGGAIVEFALGNAQSGYTLQTLGAEVDGLALDRAGNLYAAYRTSDGDGAGGIEYFAGGTGAGRDLGITLDGPQGLLVDSKGNIFAVETQGTNRIDGFHPGQTQPYATTPGTSVTPTQISFDANEGKIYSSNLSSEVDISPHPTLKSMTEYLSGDGLDSVQGMALSPPAAPSPQPTQM